MIVILIIGSSGWASVGRAGQNDDPKQIDLEQQLLQMQQQMQEMRQQMQKMQEQHEKEIQTLKDQIGQGDQPEEAKTLDEQTDLLRKLAQDPASLESNPGVNACCTGPIFVELQCEERLWNHMNAV